MSWWRSSASDWGLKRVFTKFYVVADLWPIGLVCRKEFSAANERKAGLADLLAQFHLLGKHRNFGDEQTWAGACQTLAEAATLAGDFGVTLALQIHPPVIKGYSDALRMVKQVASPHLEICFEARLDPSDQPLPLCFYGPPGARPSQQGGANRSQLRPMNKGKSVNRLRICELEHFVGRHRPCSRRRSQAEAARRCGR